MDTYFYKNVHLHPHGKARELEAQKSTNMPEVLGRLEVVNQLEPQVSPVETEPGYSLGLFDNLTIEGYISIVLTKLTLEESASTVLKGRILNGELLPGMRLIESTWSTELGVSRPTIRSAFQRLTELGLASRSNYVGWSVAALSHQDLREVAQVRAALEGFAAFLIAGNPKLYLHSKPHNELTVSLDWLAHTLDSGNRSQIDAADQAFHATLVRTCGNSRIAAQHQSISDQMTLAIRTANLTGEPHTQLYQQHLELYQQLKRGDAPAAEAAVRSHCLAVLDRFPHLQNPSQEAV